MQLCHHRGPAAPNLGREGVQELILNRHTRCRNLCFLLKQWASKKAKDFSNPQADRFLPICTEGKILANIIQTVGVPGCSEVLPTFIA